MLMSCLVMNLDTITNTSPQALHAVLCARPHDHSTTSPILFDCTHSDLGTLNPNLQRNKDAARS